MVAFAVVPPEAEPEPAAAPLCELPAEPLPELELPPGMLTGSEGVVTPVTEGAETDTDGVAETLIGTETDGVVDTVTGTEIPRPAVVTHAQRASALARTAFNCVPQSD